MELPGLITVKPQQTDTINKLAHMMGLSFMEEGWTKELLSSLDALGVDEERKLEISRAIIKYDFTVGAPYHCVYTLPDRSAAAGAYLSSELQGREWHELEAEAMGMMMNDILTEAERRCMEAKEEDMATIADFSWAAKQSRGKDFIHFFSIGVDPNKRGSGAFRRLMTPFLEYADNHKLNSYLECYSEKTEAIYGHFGFKTVKRLSDPHIEVYERLMIRTPHKA